MNKVPNIYDFFKHTDYLQAWREAEKKRNPKLTHKLLNEKLGQKNRSFFNDIEHGRKKIGAKVLTGLIEMIGLTGNEEDYFRAMVGYRQATPQAEKNYWFERIIKLNHTPKKIIDTDIYSYYKNWYNPTIRAFLEITDFEDDYEKASKMLYGRISPEEIETAIKTLRELGLVAENEKGYLKPTDKVLTTGDNFKAELMRQYHLKNHDILRDILDEDIPGTHDSSLVTVSVSEQGLRHIVNRIKHLRSEIISIAHKDEADADRVCKIAIHAYSETRKDCA